MTASRSAASAQEKKKKQRVDRGESSDPPPSVTSSSQRLEVLAASSPGDPQNCQTYRLRSAKGENGKITSEISLRPSYLAGSDSQSKPVNTPTLTPSEDSGVGIIFENSLGEGVTVSTESKLAPSENISNPPETADTSPHDAPPFSPPPPKKPNDQEVIRLSDIMARLDALSGLHGKMDAMAEDLKQLCSIKETTAELGLEVSRVKESVEDLQSAVSSLEAREEESELNLQAIAKELVDLKQVVQSMQSQQPQQPVPQQQPVSQDELAFFKLKMEAKLRWNNLIFEGIKEPHSDRDGSTRRQVLSFGRNTLGIPHVEIDSAYRLGKPRKASAPPRPILVRFTGPGDREDVWRAKTRLTDLDNDQFSIKEDLPLQLRPVMAALMRVIQTAKRFPQKYNVFIRDFRIHVNGTPYDADNLEALPKDLRPSHSSTPGNSRVVVFFGRASRFSNHYLSPFTVDDTAFK